MSASNGRDGRLKFGFNFHTKPHGTKRVPKSGDEPFRILLLGDLSGRAQRNVEDATDLGSRICLRVDVDDFETILNKYSPRIDWPIGQVEFKEIDDFHPDQLYRKLEVFNSLRETRRKLKDPNTFPDMALKLRTEERIEQSPEESTKEIKVQGDVFDRLLGRPSRPNESSQPLLTPDVLSSMIQKIIAPYILPDVDPQLDQYISSIDMAIGDQMRAILHHRDFQTIEATWRGIWDLVTGLELNENLELVLLDVTKKELFNDLRDHKTGLIDSGLHRQLIDKAIGTPDGLPWSVIIGLYDFGYNQQDIELLAALGLLASHANAPFIADARASLIGCKSFATSLEPSEWESDLPLFSELRRSHVSPWIGLAAPRVLMRLPYGKGSDEIDAFTFSELGGKPNHEHFLWGSSALACAKLFGMAFQECGWAFSLEDRLDLEDLPAYTVHTETGKELKPCAEIVMSDRNGSEISRRGLIALMSYKNRNAVRIRNIQSISDPPTSLSGPWG